MDAVLAKVLSGSRILLLVSWTASFLMTAYAIFGIEHVIPFSSDGTQFSCYVQTADPRK
jgi:hypothetical protein